MGHCHGAFPPAASEELVSARGTKNFIGAADLAVFIGKATLALLAT
jgi:hypothetical protein